MKAAVKYFLWLVVAFLLAHLLLAVGVLVLGKRAPVPSAFALAVGSASPARLQHATRRTDCSRGSWFSGQGNSLPGVLAVRRVISAGHDVEIPAGELNGARRENRAGCAS